MSKISVSVGTRDQSNQAPLYQAGYIERFGTGIGEIFRLTEEFGLLEPVIDLTEGFKVTIWRPGDGENVQVGAHAGAQVTEEVKRVLLVLHEEVRFLFHN